MEDIIEPLIVILIGGLFAPLLEQLIQNLLRDSRSSAEPASSLSVEEKKDKRRRHLKLFVYAVIIQLALFTIFFFSCKWVYFDRNYFETSERELIREGLRKGKDYIIPKLTIRIYSEANGGVQLQQNTCDFNSVNYCSLVSISYEIVALRDFNAEKIFQEYYEGLYATKVLPEPGSEIEGDDVSPKNTSCKYDIITTMKKFERRTVTTRADYLYEKLPETRAFFSKETAASNWDMFYYPNNEDDVIGEVEFQIISRTLQFNSPAVNDAIFEDASGKKVPIDLKLTRGRGECVKYNIITSRVARLKNNEKVGIRWGWN